MRRSGKLARYVLNAAERFIRVSIQNCIVFESGKLK